VPNVLHVARTTSLVSGSTTVYTSTSTGQLYWMQDRIIGAVSGKVYMGNFQAAGPVPANWNRMNFNKTAMDANMAVFGAPVIPDTWSLGATASTAP